MLKKYVFLSFALVIQYSIMATEKSPNKVDIIEESSNDQQEFNYFFDKNKTETFFSDDIEDSATSIGTEDIPDYFLYDKLSTSLPKVIYRKPSIFSRIKRFFIKRKIEQENYPMFDGIIGKFPAKLVTIFQQLEEVATQNSLPSGYLNRLIIHGPPGNGKTTIARKMAEYLGCHIKVISAPTLVNSYVGAGPNAVTQLFNDALNKAYQNYIPCIIFIDEIDAIAANVETEFRSEHKNTLQELWLNLDKFKNNPNIFVICATNHIDKLHPTFLDRFGANVIEISNPDQKTRKQILAYYAQQQQIALSQELIDVMAVKTNNFSARALEDLIGEVKSVAQMHAQEQHELDSDFIFVAIDAMAKKIKDAKKTTDASEGFVKKCVERTGLALNCYSLFVISYHLYNWIRPTPSTSI